MYTYIHTYPHSAAEKELYVRVYIHIYIFIYTQMYTYIHSCIYIYTHTAPPRIGYTGAYILMYAHKYMYIHIHIYIYTHTAPPRMGYTCACRNGSAGDSCEVSTQDSGGCGVLRAEGGAYTPVAACQGAQVCMKMWVWGRKCVVRLSLVSCGL